MTLDRFSAHFAGVVKVDSGPAGTLPDNGERSAALDGEPSDGLSSLGNAATYLVDSHRPDPHVSTAATL